MKKSLIAIIVFLLFVIVIMLLDQRDMRDAAYIELENELTQMAEEYGVLEDKVKSLDLVNEENTELSRHIMMISDKYNNLFLQLQYARFPLAKVTGAEIDGELLKLNITYVRPESYNSRNLIEVDQEQTTLVTKDVPIFMMNDWDDLILVDWDYMVSLENTPLIRIFEDPSGKPFYIREEK